MLGHLGGVLRVASAQTAQDTSDVPEQNGPSIKGLFDLEVGADLAACEGREVSGELGLRGRD